MSDSPNDEPEISGEHVPASHVFSNEIVNLISEEDITKIIEMQRYMLGRYEKTNEMLVTVTELASQRFEVLGNEFKNHTTTLLEMKKDLDSIFKRINNLKQIMSKRYPKEFDIALCNSTRLLEEDEDASDDALSLGASAPEDTISLPDAQNTQQLSVHETRERADSDT